MNSKKSQILKKFPLLQLYSRAEAPNRDYYGLTIAETCNDIKKMFENVNRRQQKKFQIRFNIWKVTRGPHNLPKETILGVNEFKKNKYIQEEVKNSFGENVYDYIIDLSNNKRKLENLPQGAFLNIIKYLSVNDILSLSRTNKIFYELCNSEAVWEQIFKKVLRKKPSSEEKVAALDRGWKETLKWRLSTIRRAPATRATKTKSQTVTVLSTPKPPIKPAINLTPWPMPSVKKIPVTVKKKAVVGISPTPSVRKISATVKESVDRVSPTPSVRKIPVTVKKSSVVKISPTPTFVRKSVVRIN